MINEKVTLFLFKTSMLRYLTAVINGCVDSSGVKYSEVQLTG